MAPPERPRRAPKAPQGRWGGPRRTTGGKPKPPYRQRDDEGPVRERNARGQGERKPYPKRDTDRGGRAERRDGPSSPREGRARRDGPPRRDRAVAQERPAPKGWGGVTRRGARQVTNPTPATEESKAYERRERPAATRPEVDRWESERVPSPRAAKRPKASGRPIRAKALPPEVAREVVAVAPNARRAPMLQKRLGDAARHIQHGRDQEAAGILRQLAQEVPEAASVRELYGQALYSLGRYRQAAKEFEAFIDLTGSTDQHPMLADSYRALGRHTKVKELWAELREASPSPDIVSEGRIVAAGSLADQGKLRDAVKLLESAPPVRGRVADRHLRTWYALADLYERSGELSKSRSLFRRVVQHDADFADAVDRLRALG